MADRTPPHPFGWLSAAEALAGAEEAQRILRQASTEAIVSRAVDDVDQRLRREMPALWWLTRTTTRIALWLRSATRRIAGRRS